MGTQDEVHGIGVQVATAGIRVEIREPIAVGYLVTIKVGRVGKVLHEDRPRQEILVCHMLWHVTRDTEMLVLVEPQNMKVAATVG